MNDSTSRALSQPTLEPELRASVERNEASACVIAAVLGARLVPRMPRLPMRVRYTPSGRIRLIGRIGPAFEAVRDGMAVFDDGGDAA